VRRGDRSCQRHEHFGAGRVGDGHQNRGLAAAQAKHLRVVALRGRVDRAGAGCEPERVQDGPQAQPDRDEHAGGGHREGLVEPEGQARRAACHGDGGEERRPKAVRHPRASACQVPDRVHYGEADEEDEARNGAGRRDVGDGDQEQYDRPGGETYRRGRAAPGSDVCAEA
jgi:hypothetical protein